jgi:hypothetical protein
MWYLGSEYRNHALAPPATLSANQSHCSWYGNGSVYLANVAEPEPVVSTGTMHDVLSPTANSANQ